MLKTGKITDLVIGNKLYTLFPPFFAPSFFIHIFSCLNLCNWDATLILVLKHLERSCLLLGLKVAISLGRLSGIILLLDQISVTNLFLVSRNEMPSNPKPKSKKKPKKAKFKSLKKGSLTSELKNVKEEPSMETMSIDDDVIYHEEVTYSDVMSPYSSTQKKRKKVELTIDVEAEKSSRKKSKKFKKTPEMCPLDLDSNMSGKQHDDSMEFRSYDNAVVDLEHKPASRSKMGGKISITAMPVKRVLMIKPEKVKKGNIWSRDCVPSPDLWLPQEDAILCAVVHEYGPHWSLVSETLYGMTAGGFYRGRYRHPIHCCERFRELIQRYVLSAPENPINEKMSNTGSGKALLKVTEVSLTWSLMFICLHTLGQIENKRC